MLRSSYEAPKHYLYVTRKSFRKRDTLRKQKNRNFDIVGTISIY